MSHLHIFFASNKFRFCSNNVNSKNQAWKFFIYIESWQRKEELIMQQCKQIPWFRTVKNDSIIPKTCFLHSVLSSKWLLFNLIFYHFSIFIFSSDSNSQWQNRWYLMKDERMQCTLLHGPLWPTEWQWYVWHNK